MNAVGETVGIENATRAASRPLDLTAVHAAHADFVWKSLQRLGVREADLEDQFQEVFVVVHQRLAGFEGRSQLTTWLFGICLRVAAAYRRRGYVRREQPTEVPPDDPLAPAGATPEEAAAARQANERVQRLLDEMDLEKRAVFVMAEIEEMSSEQIAAIVGVPVGTVFSRLHAARKQFEQAVARMHARERHGAGGAR